MLIIRHGILLHAFQHWSDNINTEWLMQDVLCCVFVFVLSATNNRMEVCVYARGCIN